MGIVGLDEERAMHLVARTALDSIPKERRRIIQRMASVNAPQTIDEIGEWLWYPGGPVERAFEDLWSHGVVRRFGHGWCASEWLVDTWRDIHPLIGGGGRGA
jgi:hypothetical protein